MIPSDCSSDRDKKEVRAMRKNARKRLHREINTYLLFWRLVRLDAYQEVNLK